MKKFLNDPVHFVDEMLEGIYKAHPAVTYAAGDKRCLVTAKTKPGKVGIATGGGSGHLPLFLGYVGDGMLDGCAVGGVFQSPSAEQMYQVTKHIDQGAGVLYIYGNYSGDIINFDMAAELADLDGIAVKQVVGNDDVASSVVGEEHKRRGVAGIFFVYKAAGAAADAVIDEMMERIFAEQDYKAGDSVAVLVNGLGGTPMEELYILFRRVSELLEGRGVTAKHVWVGEFATAMEMAGASVSILHLDEELDRLVAAPANTPFFKHIAG